MPAEELEAFPPPSVPSCAGSPATRGMPHQVQRSRKKHQVSPLRSTQVCGAEDPPGLLRQLREDRATWFSKESASPQVAVVGVPDARLGEVGCAFVVAAEGRSVDPSELIAWARENMANYKVPRRVFVLDALPLNANGKVRKSELRARVAG